MLHFLFFFKKKMRPEIIDMGKHLAKHMINEDILKREIEKYGASKLEAEFLESCIKEL